MYSIRHYVIKYIDMLLSNYEDIWWFTGNIYVLPKIRYDSILCNTYLTHSLSVIHFGVVKRVKTQAININDDPFISYLGSFDPF